MQRLLHSGGMIDPGWRTLPKFIVADKNSRDDESLNTYIIHCYEPRFLMKFSLGDNEGEFFEIDATDDDELVAKLRHEARALYRSYLG